MYCKWPFPSRAHQPLSANTNQPIATEAIDRRKNEKTKQNKHNKTVAERCSNRAMVGEKTRGNKQGNSVACVQSTRMTVSIRLRAMNHIYTRSKKQIWIHDRVTRMRCRIAWGIDGSTVFIGLGIYVCVVQRLHYVVVILAVWRLSRKERPTPCILPWRWRAYVKVHYYSI